MSYTDDAPAVTIEQYREFVVIVEAWVEQERLHLMGWPDDGNAPGHSHRYPGVWDWDNRHIAGRSCLRCEIWDDLRAALYALAAPSDPQEQP